MDRRLVNVVVYPHIVGEFTDGSKAGPGGQQVERSSTGEYLIDCSVPQPYVKRLSIPDSWMLGVRDKEGNVRAVRMDWALPLRLPGNMDGTAAHPIRLEPGAEYELVLLVDKKPASNAIRLTVKDN